MVQDEGEDGSIDPGEAAEVNAWLAGQGRTCPVCGRPASDLEVFALRIGMKAQPDGGGLDTSDYHYALIRCTNCKFAGGEVCLEDVGLRTPPRF